MRSCSLLAAALTITTILYRCEVEGSSLVATISCRSVNTTLLPRASICRPRPIVSLSSGCINSTQVCITGNTGITSISRATLDSDQSSSYTQLPQSMTTTLLPSTLLPMVRSQLPLPTTKSLYVSRSRLDTTQPMVESLLSIQQMRSHLFQEDPILDGSQMLTITK